MLERLRKSKTIRVGILCALIAVGYFVYEGKVSTARIGVASGSAPSCRLDLAGASEDDIKARITVTNPTAAPIGIPERYLPEWGRVSTKLFNVDRDGSELRFGGRFVDKVVKPTDLVQIEPGTEARVKVSLTRAGYDVRGHGRFAITYETTVWSGGRGLVCASNALVVQK